MRDDDSRIMNIHHGPKEQIDQKMLFLLSTYASIARISVMISTSANKNVKIVFLKNLRFYDKKLLTPLS